MPIEANLKSLDFKLISMAEIYFREFAWVCVANLLRLCVAPFSSCACARVYVYVYIYVHTHKCMHACMQI